MSPTDPRDDEQPFAATPRARSWRLIARTGCPVCGADVGAPFLSLPYDEDPIAEYLRTFYDGAIDPTDLSPQRFELHRCHRCNLVYQGLVPAAAGLALLYGETGHARSADDMHRDLSARLAYLHDLERVIRSRGGASRDVRVLDFGAGSGRWLQMAAALGCATAASELDPAALDRLSRQGHETHAPDALPRRRFDMINAEQVLEHLIEPKRVLVELSAALRPGGIIRLSVPNGSDIEERLADPDWTAPKGSTASLNAVAPLEHVNCFDHDSLIHLAVGCGLTPFRFPLRTEIHSTARVRYALSALKHRLRPPNGTLLYFRA